MTAATSRPDLISVASAGTGGAVTTASDSLTATRTSAPSTLEALQLSEQARSLARNVHKLHEDVDQINVRTDLHEWRIRTAHHARLGNALAALTALADMGLAWRDISKLIGVSVPAVQKWRRGGEIANENKIKIFGLAAVFDLLAAPLQIHDGGSWFQVPLSPDAPITPIDLWAAGKEELVFELAHENTNPDAVLDKFDPAWRERYRSDFEVFRADDGDLSVRTKAR